MLYEDILIKIIMVWNYHCVLLHIFAVKTKFLKVGSYKESILFFLTVKETKIATMNVLITLGSGKSSWQMA